MSNVIDFSKAQKSKEDAETPTNVVVKSSKEVLDRLNETIADGGMYLAQLYAVGADGTLRGAGLVPMTPEFVPLEIAKVPSNVTRFLKGANKVIGGAGEDDLIDMGYTEDEIAEIVTLSAILTISLQHPVETIYEV